MTEPNPSPRPLPLPGAPVSADVEAAFTGMVEAHYARLGAFAYRLVGSREAAEDVVHEVLLRIWRRGGAFDYRDPLGYLYQAVRNEAQSQHRRAARYRQAGGSDRAAEEAVDRGADPSQTVELHDLARVIEATVAALPPRRREIFRMHREQRLSYAEIAALLDISVKTVEIQIGHALKTIRRHLAPFLALAVTLLK